MILIILTTVLIIAIFAITFLNLIKENNTNYIYLLIVEFLGILIDLLSIIFKKNISTFKYILIYLLSVIIPVMLMLFEKKGIYIGEIIGIIKIKIRKQDEKKILIDLILKYPNSYFAHKELANYYEKNQEKEKSEDEYIKTIQIKPTDYKSYCNLARVLNENKKTNDAINVLQNLLKGKPEYYQGSMLLGKILYDNNLLKEAVIVYNEALKHNPSDYQIYYALGMTYTRLNDFQNAKEYYKKAATINSLKDISNLNLGQINMIFRDYEKSEKYFFEIIKSDDEKIVANGYYYLAKIRLIQRNEVQAIQYANLAIEIYPELIRKIEKDNLFLSIIGKLRLPENRKVKSKVSNKEEEIIEYLGKTFNVVENLTDNLQEKDSSKEREI